MTVNRYTGETEIRLAREPYTLVYDFRALTEIGSIEESLKFLMCFGSKQAVAALLADNMKHLPAIVAAGLKRHHPDMAAERVEASLRPLRPVLTAVVEAIWAAIEDPDPEPAEANPPPAAQPTSATETR